MSVYLGTLGRLVELKCPSSQSLSEADRFSFGRTLEGRVKAQATPLARRQWGVSVATATPQEVGALAGFASGEWGYGPFVWVSTDAPVTNMLTPDAGSCAPGAYVLGSGTAVTAAGPMLTPDGWAGRSYIKSTVNSLFFGVDRVPVLPGEKVTASAYVLGAGAAAAVVFYDAANSVVSSTVSTVTATAGTVVRSHITQTAPANAVSCRPYVNAATTQTTRPALTWTSQLFEWADGQGCPKAVISGLSRDLVLALREPSYGRYADASFTITEVG